MPDLEKLQIELGADSTTAIKAIDNLISKLGSLNSALNTLNPSSIGMLAQNVQSLASAMNSTKDMDSRRFKTLAQNLTLLTNVDGAKLATTADGMRRVASAMTTLGETNYDGQSLRTVASSISSLNSTSAVSANLPVLSEQLEKFIISLNAMGQVTFQTDTLRNIITQINKLGGETAVTASSNLPVLTEQLEKFIISLNAMQSVTFDTSKMAELVKAINGLGKVATGRAIQNIPELGNKIKQLFTVLSTCPKVSSDVTRLISALGSLNGKVASVQPNSRVASSGLNGLTSSMRNAHKSTKSLAYMFGKFYANFFLLIRGIKGLWGSIESSMDFIETFNYFQSSFDQVAQNSNKAMEEMGKESADSYFNGFSKQALQLTKKMSGYTVGKNGQLESTNEVSLGVNPDTLLNYQAQFAQISSSIGVASDYAVKLSDALSMIGADLASVKNMQNADVWDNLSSAIVGQSKAVDKYGINIREAALQEQLANLGIDVSIKKLSQQDKALLRTITILNSSKYAWADLSDTLSQPSNQIKMLKANVESLGRTIGGMFLGALAKVLPYINAFIIALRKLAEYIINLFGIEIPTITSSTANSIEGLEDDVSGVGDALDGASNSAKKLKQNLLGIDELTVISGDDDSGGSGGAGGLGGITSDLYKAFDDIFDEYQKVWQKAYEGVENEAQRLADKIVNAIKKGDWYKIGRTISDYIRKQLDKIKWDKIFSAVRKFGTNMADFLNGLINPELFGTIGRTLANGLNSIAYYIQSFAGRFDWINLGLSLASMLNNFVDTLDAKAIADAVNKGLLGVLTAINAFLRKVKWFELGQKIGTFLAEIKWGEILLKVGEAICTALLGAISASLGIIQKSPIAGTIALAITGLFTANWALGIAEKIAKAFGASNVVNKLGLVGSEVTNGISKGAVSSLKSVGGIWGLLTKNQTFSGGLVTTTAEAQKFATVLGADLIGAFVAALAGFSLGEWLAVNWFGQDEKMLLSNNIDELKQFIADKFGTGENSFEGVTRSNERAKKYQSYTEGLSYILKDALKNSKKNKLASEYGFDINSYINTSLDPDKAGELVDVLNSLKDIKFDLNIGDTQSVNEALEGYSIYYGEITDETKDFVKAISENYYYLSAQERAFLEATYGLEAYAGGVVQTTEEIDKARNSVDDFSESAKNHEMALAKSKQANENYKNGLIPLPSAIQTAIETQSKFNDVTESYHRLVSDNIYEIQKYCESLEYLTNDVLKRVNISSKTQADAINSTIEATKQYAKEQGGASTTISNASDKYGDFVNALNMSSISSSELSDYVNTLSNTDIPQMSTNLDGLVTNMQKQIPLAHTEVTTAIDGIKTELEGLKTYFDENIKPIGDAKAWKEALSGVPKAFNEVFEGACKGVIAIFNKMIASINNAFDLSWDSFEIGGEEVVEGGTHKLLEIKKIEGFANGGYPKTGDLFYANEKGAELVGTMNGKTAVSSNGEITGIRQAIYDVATEIMNEMRNGSNVNVTLQGDARGLFNAVRNEAKVYKRSTMRNAFEF